MQTERIGNKKQRKRKEYGQAKLEMKSKEERVNPATEPREASSLTDKCSSVQCVQYVKQDFFEGLFHFPLLFPFTYWFILICLCLLSPQHHPLGRFKSIFPFFQQQQESTPKKTNKRTSNTIQTSTQNNALWGCGFCIQYYHVHSVLLLDGLLQHRLFERIEFSSFFRLQHGQGFSFSLFFIFTLSFLASCFASNPVSNALSQSHKKEK